MRLAKRLGCASAIFFCVAIALIWWNVRTRTDLSGLKIASITAVAAATVLGFVALWLWRRRGHPFAGKSGWSAFGFSIALAFLICIVLTALVVALLFFLPSLQPQGTGFEAYRSPSPDGQYVLDVRKLEGEGACTTFAEFSVLDSETEVSVYDCPDGWRVWDLWGIDWLSDGTVFVDSSDVGVQRYGPDALGNWVELDRGVGVSGTPTVHKSCVSIFERNGWHTLDTPGGLMSFDASSVLRIDADHRRVDLPAFLGILSERNAEELSRLRVGTGADGRSIYVTKDAYVVSFREFDVLSTDKLF